MYCLLGNSSNIWHILLWLPISSLYILVQNFRSYTRKYLAPHLDCGNTKYEAGYDRESLMIKDIFPKRSIKSPFRPEVCQLWWVPVGNLLILGSLDSSFESKITRLRQELTKFRASWLGIYISRSRDLEISLFLVISKSRSRAEQFREFEVKNQWYFYTIA
jgi:hypothetical protein